MQIDRISRVSKTPASTAEWSPLEVQSKPNVASSPTTAPQAAVATSAVPNASAVSSTTSIPKQLSAKGLQVTTVAATYSRTVSGKSYPESIVESGGVYIASVPSPPGIRASGTTVESAENNLNMKLDTLI
jgi:hypothetical protein